MRMFLIDEYHYTMSGAYTMTCAYTMNRAYMMKNRYNVELRPLSIFGTCVGIHNYIPIWHVPRQSSLVKYVREVYV